MLLLPALSDPPVSGATCFEDQIQSDVVYELPLGLGPVTDAAGSPDFIFIRYRAQDGVGGGMFRVNLGWRRATVAEMQAVGTGGFSVRPVTWRAVRFRIVRRAV